jgi:murein DD-endopeptidase MepM/ murein hydrolase activator NlpD
MSASAAHTPLPFTVAMSFLMGIVTTIAAYSMRDEPRMPTPTPEPHPAAVVAESVPLSEVDDVDALRERDLKIPVDGIDRDKLRNTFSEARGSRSHEALDILAPRGTKVLAVDDGRIQKLFTSKAGGITIYQFDPSNTYSYYYAHLDRYVEGLLEGQGVKRGDVIGYVGSTGNASPDAPHLHFAIFRLEPERQWWKGDPTNPYLIFSKP